MKLLMTLKDGYRNLQSCLCLKTREDSPFFDTSKFATSSTLLLCNINWYNDMIVNLMT